MNDIDSSVDTISMTTKMHGMDKVVRSEVS